MAILSAAQACLIPQSVDPVTTRPHTIPRVDLSKLPPYLLRPQVALFPRGPGDATPPCHCELDIRISPILADDPTVDVEARWFVDYDLNDPRSQAPVSTVVVPGSFATGDTSRPLPDFIVNADALGFVTGTTGTTHVVELVLAERLGFAPDTVSPPHRAMKAGFEQSTFKFVVLVAPSPTSLCEQREPQVRRCP